MLRDYITYLIRLIVRPKLLILGIVTFFILFQIYFFQPHNIENIPEISSLIGSKQEIIDPNQENVENIIANKVYVNDENTDISRSYSSLIQLYGDTFHRLSYKERCSRYFNYSYQEDPNWALSDFHDLPYDGSIFGKEKDYIDQKVDSYKSEHYKDLSDEEANKKLEQEKIREFYQLEYNGKIKENQDTERKMIDASTHMRVFGSCFMNQTGYEVSSGTSDSEIDAQCTDIEKRLMPWLSGKFPLYKRWNGKEHRKLPVMSFPSQTDYIEPIPDTKCFTKNFKQQLNGKGIAISASDEYADLLVGLLALLRALGSKLPLQIVHKGDLSSNTQERLIKVARMDTPDISKVQNFDFILEKRNLTDTFDVKNKTQVECLFPKMELWFVNVEDAISGHYKEKFEKHANKMLAFFFSSFEDTILLDADTVPVSDLESTILGSKEYQEKGAFFFRDREIKVHGQASDRKFFEKLMPNKIDTALFNIPPSTDMTLKNPYIGELYWHYMEAGMVVVNKAKHFTGVLTIVQLQLWKHSASKVWGDKELFWLGLSISGDEEYYMNELTAGSVGQLTPKSQRIYGGRQLKSKELCSNHPAHVLASDNSTLVWFNSGYTECKKPETANEDFDKYKPFQKIFQSKQELEDHYKSVLKIEAVIVPVTDDIEFINENGEYPSGWWSRGTCDAYSFCAYDKLGGSDAPEHQGLLIQFDREQQSIYEYYGSVWVNGDDIFHSS